MAKLVISKSNRSLLRPGTVIRIYDWGVGVVFENSSSGIVRVRLKSGETKDFTPKYFKSPVECDILEKHDPVVYKNGSYRFADGI